MIFDIFARLIPIIVLLGWIGVWVTVLGNFEKANGHRPLLKLILWLSILHTAAAFVNVITSFTVVIGISQGLTWAFLMWSCLLGIEALVTYLLGRKIMGQDWKGKNDKRF